jgi:hypothetical protein
MNSTSDCDSNAFEEDSRYGADFGSKVEPGWEKPRHQLKQDLKELLLD